MMRVSYVPGGRTAIAGARCWLVIDAPPGSAAVGELWEQIQRGSELDALVAGLLRAGLGRIPDFALLAAVDSDHHLICRGSAGATLIAADTSESVEAGRLRTWLERVVAADTTRVILGELPADSALRLPATAGIFLADSLTVHLAPTPLDHFPAAGPAGDLYRRVPDEQERQPGFSVTELTVPDPRPPEPGMAPAVDLTAGVAEPDPAEAQDVAEPREAETKGVAEPRAAVAEPHQAVATAVADPEAHGPAGQAGQATAPAQVADVPEAPGATTAAAGPDTGWPGGDAVSASVAGEDTSYDFLFAATQARTVEDAAIRPAADADPDLLTAVPLVAEPQDPPPLPGNASIAKPEPSAPPPAPPFIEAVPWEVGVGGRPYLRTGTTSRGTLAERLNIVRRRDRETDKFDSAIRAATATGPAEAAEADIGVTVKRGDLGAVLARPAPNDRIGPTVQAILCAQSHPNPPSSSTCRLCAAPLPQLDPVTVPRPVLGVLQLSTGDVITLDRGVVMGRAPSTDFDGDERPHIVKLRSSGGEISRTHLEVSLDGWHVLVTDLKSTNGTLVQLPGCDPEQLRPGEPTPITPGTIVTLAEDINFRYEVAE